MILFYRAERRYFNRFESLSKGWLEMKNITLSLILLLGVSISTNAVSLEKRHQLGLKVGMWSQTNSVRTEIALSGVETTVGNNGAMGGIFYGHWIQENFELTVNIEGMALDVSTESGLFGVSSETSSVSAFLIGGKYYFVNSTLQSSVRPFVRGSVGPFIGSQSSNTISPSIIVESRTETAIGAQFAGGLSFLTTSYLMRQIEVSYNLMTDFDAAIGGSKNYSGPGFSFNCGWLFGGGVASQNQHIKTSD